MTCGLCHREFEVEEAKNICASNCGISRCSGVRCPYCYWEMLPEPSWVNKLFSMFSSEKTTDIQRPEEVQLHKFKTHVKTEICRLDAKNENQLKKLIALGILPGTSATLVQSFPSYVLQIGFNQFSIDTELASIIYVRKTGD